MMLIHLYVGGDDAPLYHVILKQQQAGNVGFITHSLLSYTNTSSNKRRKIPNVFWHNHYACFFLTTQLGEFLLYGGHVETGLSNHVMCL